MNGQNNNPVMPEIKNNNGLNDGLQPGGVLTNGNNTLSSEATEVIVPNPVPGSNEQTLTNINVSNEDILNDNTSLMSFDFPSANSVSDNIQTSNTENNINNNLNMVQTPVGEIGSNNLSDMNNISNNNLNVDQTSIGETGNNNGSNINNNINDTGLNVNDNIVSVKKYLGYMILFMIPVVGFIMLIVKALDKNDKNISNYAKAQLILVGIFTALSVIVTVLFSALLVSLVGSISGSSTNNNYSNGGINEYYDYDYDRDYDTVMG